MNDLGKLKALLDEFGVGYEEEIFGDETHVSTTEGSAKVEGYSSFYTSFRFDHTGKFLKMGAWE